MKSPMRIHRQYNTQYTDLAVVIGPDVRWTEDDANDLQDHYPEVFLGYRVYLLTVSDLRQGLLRGRRIHTAIILTESTKHPEWERAYQELLPSMLSTPGHPGIQYWWVHRYPREVGPYGVTAVKTDWR